MTWNIGGNRNLFLKPKSKMRLYHVAHTTPKNSRVKFTLTVVEKQRLPDIEETDSKDEISCQTWAIYNGMRKVCVHLRIDTDKLNSFVYRYRNSLNLKDYEFDPKLTKNQSLLAKRIFLLSYIDIFYKR